MTTEEISEIAKTKGSDALLAVHQEWISKRAALLTEFRDACDTYFTDATRRAEQIKGRIATLQEQATSIDSQIKSVRPALINATVTGDSAELQSIQGKLADLEAEKAAALTQINLLSDATVRGDEKLYEAAVSKKDELDRAISEAYDVDEAIGCFAQGRVREWNGVLDVLYPRRHEEFAYAVPDPYGCEAQFEKLVQHFKNGGEAEP